MEKFVRSVFVGNLPSEATEEQVRDICAQVGPVNSFRLVKDPQSGQPKGYGYCEYTDEGTARSAIRNLNGFNYRGHVLKVDNAWSENALKELQSHLVGMTKSPQPAKRKAVPEDMSTNLSALPPEKMFDVMKMIKSYALSRPAEAYAMLQQNPQMTYALLHGLVAMKLVDPAATVSLLRTVDVGEQRKSEAKAKGEAEVGEAKAAKEAEEQEKKEEVEEKKTAVVAATAAAEVAEVAKAEGPVAEIPTEAQQMTRLMKAARRFTANPRDPRLRRDDAIRGSEAAVAAAQPQGFAPPPGPPPQGPSLQGPYPPGPVFQGPGLPGPPIPGFCFQGNAFQGPGFPGPAGLVDLSGQMGFPMHMHPPPTSPEEYHQLQKALIVHVLQLNDAQLAALAPEQQRSVLLLREQIRRNLPPPQCPMML